MEKEKVIIIGAGIAGLVVAADLADKYEVTILEATDRAGGRIYSYTNSSFTGIVEGGAEFLHGSTKHTRRLLREAGVNVAEVGGKMYRRENGKWVEQKEMVEGWDDLLGKMDALEEDITLHDFLQQYYAGEQYAALRGHIINYAEGFDSVNINKAGVKALYQEWSHEGAQYRVKGGYGKMVDYLLKKCLENGSIIHFESIVKQVQWQPGNVIVQANDGKVYTAARCIITAPVGVLQSTKSRAGISIVPEPIDNYTGALNDIGYGSVVKLVMQFGKPLWPEDAGFMFTDEPFPTWWTQLPSHAPLLTCWAGGSGAAALSHYNEAQLLDIALSSMSRIFDRSKKEINKYLQAARVFNWANVDTALGSYSYATPESEVARRRLLQPVDNTLYFSGEGLYYGPYPGTVEAAIIAAQYTVSRIKSNVSQ